ncbi:hypothetical protein ZIOFF_038002 [Zingiber officinale]|uniref:Cation/H+ exchanger transmembrane domain-containing protein n=1 Tax=Zingiber officinale TaxID=94328 RepID=A0A8J5GT35_ZINOF|nr:hypothetical protein ZIOFF_038002 [Zingiber officinale]
MNDLIAAGEVPDLLVRQPRMDLACGVRMSSTAHDCGIGLGYWKFAYRDEHESPMEESEVEHVYDSKSISPLVEEKDACQLDELRELLHAIAEFGVVFLLFNIGLELSVERLSSMKKYVFGLGSSQVLVTAAVVGLVVYFFRWATRCCKKEGRAHRAMGVLLSLCALPGIPLLSKLNFCIRLEEYDYPGHNTTEMLISLCHIISDQVAVGRALDLPVYFGDAGSKEVVPETLEPSLQLAAAVLAQ